MTPHDSVIFPKVFSPKLFDYRASEDTLFNEMERRTKQTMSNKKNDKDDNECMGNDLPEDFFDNFPGPAEVLHCSIEDPMYDIGFPVSELKRIQELILQNEDCISFTDYLILERISMTLSYDHS
jgi:hypothetical protein